MTRTIDSDLVGIRRKLSDKYLVFTNFKFQET